MIRRSVEILRAPDEEKALSALTVLQPFATAIVSTELTAKRVENRSWPRTYPKAGQWVAIHAGRSWYPGNADTILSEIETYTGWGTRRDPTGAVRVYPLGALLGIARFVGCVQPGEVPIPQRGWAVGPWCHVIDDVRPLPSPIPCRGALGFWRVPDEHVPALRALL